MVGIERFGTLEIVAGAISLGLFGLYHTYFLGVIFLHKKSACRINLIFNNRVRRRWVEYIMLTKGSEILGVQTIRNSIMASSFFATGAITAAFFVLNFQNFSEGEESASTTLFYVLSMVLMIAFISFALAIRDFSHASFLCSSK